MESINTTGAASFFNSAAKTILATGFTAGTLDILAAFINTSIKLEKFAAEIVLRFIASGVFGNDAFSGGGQMVAAGLFFHYIIALSFTIAYFFIYPRLSFLKKNKILNGITYGLVIWLIMNLIVVPLSMTPELKFSIEGMVTGIIILMVCVGLPVSFFTNRYYSGKIY